MDQLSLVPEYYTIQALVPAINAIGGKAYWDECHLRSGELYRPTALDKDFYVNLTIARRAHGAMNIRVVKVTQEVLMGVANGPA